MPTSPSWHARSIEEITQALSAPVSGLSSEEAKKRLSQYGENKLPEVKQRSLISIFFSQFKSPLIYVLLSADIIIFFLKETIDGFIILFILLFNAILGTIQEGRAENTLAALKSFVETRAEVLRDGKEINVPDTDIVPGDIILVQEGEKIPADARVIEARSLRVSEAALTGESEPVRKTTDVLPAEILSSSDQKNMLFKGTAVAAGSGKAIVVETGAGTVIGKISQAIAGVRTEIPLTKNISQLARVVVSIVLCVIALLFILGVYEGKEVKEMFISAVAIAVAAVPEGLPLVLTVTLATGVWRMAKRRVLVKKLPAVEALGQAEEIAVDKTGTITKNELVVTRLITGDNTHEIKGVGYEPSPALTHPEADDIELAARIGLLCSNARVTPSEKGEYRIVGDPTEGAMNVFAAKAGKEKEALLKEFRLVTDWPFDYQKKLHVSLTEKGDSLFLAITGAPEVIIERASVYRIGGEEKTFSPEEKKRLTERFIAESNKGSRVIAYGYALPASREVTPDSLPPLVFGGLFIMADTLRPNIRESVEKAKEAGIRVIMITGDHAATAEAIARDAGIFTEGDKVLSGAEIDGLSAEALAKEIFSATVFARVTPEHKTKIISAYRKAGKVIAMTGDGVNDAPSLVTADLGIAMGKIGTEVAKEAADLILLDDNFGDILSAVQEGRNMRQGIRRTITYLFSSNLGEIILITLALLFGLPLPLVAAQIIWMNVVTDTFFDISLALEPKDPALMGRGVKIRKKLFDGFTAKRLAIVAPLIAVFSFFFFVQEVDADLIRARTLALTSLIVFQWFNALNCRSEEKSVFRMNPFSNKFLLATLVLVIALHSFALYTPFMNTLLQIEPISLADWGMLVGAALSVLGAEEIRKLFMRRTMRLSLARQ